MYYTAVQGSSMQLALATSADGITWTQYGNGPIIPAGVAGSWDGMAQCFCDVYYDGQTYYMWYIGVSDYSKGRTIGLATSQDGIHWNKYSSNPVLTPTGAGWESASLGQPTVTFSHDKFYMVYGAAPDMGVHWSLGVATSTDGIQWNRYSSNPVLTPQAEWEGNSLGVSSLLARDSTFHLWYSAFDSLSGVWQTGHATSIFSSVGVAERKNLPTKYQLFQCYPNPFNPSTQIKYSIIQKSHVSLKVYDILGKEVATIVDEEQEPGEKSISWVASGVASGIYFYQLRAQGFIDTRKMILLK